MTELFLNKGLDGDSGWLEAGGVESYESGREIQKTIKLTGGFGGGIVTMEVDFGDNDPAPVILEDNTVQELTGPCVFKVMLSPQSRVRLVLSGSTGATLTAWGN